jgi:hypothetical protein
MNQHEGGWIKIGQTSTEDNKDKWESAMNRISQESRTGIPEVCQLYDVFEYPYKDGHVDDVIRNLLTDDIYQLESSKAHNQEIDKYEIKAGREFVYGVTRNQVLNAIAKYERNLILENYGKDVFKDLMTYIKNNNKLGEIPFEPNVNNDTTEINDPKFEWCNQLWDKVISGLNGIIKEHINNPKGRPYIFFKSSTFPNLTYSIGYSTRFGMSSVGVEIFQGEDGRKSVEDFIVVNKINSSIPNLKIKQGVKDKGKWAWSVSDTIEKSDEELVEWYVSTILLFYREFERVPAV